MVALPDCFGDLPGSTPRGYTLIVSSFLLFCLFAEHPLPDVRRTMQHRDALCSASVEKANSFEIDQAHFPEIQRDPWSSACDLGSQLIEVFAPQLPAQPNARAPLTRNRFNLQRHGSDARTLEGNWVAILNWLKKKDLEEEGDARLRPNGVRWANARRQ